MKINRILIAGHFSRKGIIRVEGGYVNTGATNCTLTKPCVVLTMSEPPNWNETHVYMHGTTAKRLAKDLIKASEVKVIPEKVPDILKKAIKKT